MKVKNDRKSRLIIRNLSFKADEKKVREHFEKFGEISDVNIPKRDDGKYMGFGFVQFTRVNDAAKAIRQATGKSFLGRDIVLDWAVPKNVYLKHVGGESNGSGGGVNNEIKVEDEDDVEIKDEKDDDDEQMDIKDEDDSNGDNSSDEEEDDNSNDEEDDDDDDDDDEDEDIEDKKPIKKEKKKSDNDVRDQKTIFVRNVPFEATDDDLRNGFLQFGPIEYARIVYRPVTKHSAGTGFVKFKTKDSADLCLNAGYNEIKVLDWPISPTLALPRDDLRKKIESEKKDSDKKKCARNLYLLKEGLILSGTPAAENVSSSDMTKRLQLEQTRKELLNNLTNFVSRERLTIHNVPIDWDNRKLKDMIYREVKLKPKECRVQRDRKTTIEYPEGISKEYAFISFAQHGEALRCLRKINNNPNIWGKNRRPIVSFSIESKKAIELKRKRLEISKQKNPTYQQKMASNDDSKINIKKLKKKAKESLKTINTSLETFSGITVNPKNTSNFRKNSKINNELESHLQNVKSTKKQAKKLKQKVENRLRRQQNQKLAKIARNATTKKKVDKSVDNFDKLVEKYKQKMDKNVSKNIVKKSKWYE